MSKENEMLIEISTDHPFEKNTIYAGLFLPATKSQIENSMQQARAVKRETLTDIRVHSCVGLPELMDTRLECPTVDELNFFAYRLTTLDERDTLALNAIFNQRKENGNYDEAGVSMKELINLTYGLSDVPVVGGVDSDEKLGEFVLENDMDEALKYVSKEVVHLLNKEKIGKEFRESENGTFIDRYYVSAGNYQEQNIYDGENLPDELPHEYGEGVFCLRLIQRYEKRQVKNETSEMWLNLPIEKEKVDKIAAKYGEEGIEKCVCIGLKSSIPCVDRQMYSNMEDFEKLNELAEMYVSMNDANKVKFKAIMQSTEPKNLDEALKIIDSMSEYEFSYYSNHAENYAAEYLSRVLPSDADMDLFSSEVKQSIGKRLLNKMSATMTEYGVISKKGKGLFPTSQNEVQTQDEEQGIGEMLM